MKQISQFSQIEKRAKPIGFVFSGEPMVPEVHQTMRSTNILLLASDSLVSMSPLGNYRMVIENTIPSTLRCLLQFDVETGRWNGHCLDIDLATSGKDPDQAWKNLLAVVRLHVEHCFTHWRKGLTLRASPSEIAMFEALAGQQPTRREKITFNLVPPQTEEIPPLWIEAAEMSGEAVRAETACASVQ